MSDCSSCGDYLVSGTIPLTETLLSRIKEKKLASLESSDVEPYLASNFDMRMSYPVSQIHTEIISLFLFSELGTEFSWVQNDTEIPKSMVPSLKISIVSSLVTEPESSREFPIWGEIVEHANIS